MSFPTTSVLDDFNRANESPLSQAGAWSDDGSNGLQLVSNAVSSSSSNKQSHRTTQPPANCEAFVTIATKPSDGQSVNVRARISSLGTSPNGYFVHALASSGTDVLTIQRFDAGANTTLATVNQEFASGDSIGIQIVGSRIGLWYKASAGSWTELTSTTDATYTAAGYIGIGGFSTSWTLDSFGGGAASLVSSGAGIAGLTGAGNSASFYTKAGRGVAGLVGAGARQSTSGATYTKAGRGVVGLVGSGPKSHSHPGVTSTKAGRGIVGNVATGNKGTGASEVHEDVVPTGISIAFGQPLLEPYPTWTRIDT